MTRSAGGAQQDADTWYRQLSRLYTLAQPVVQRYEGTLQPVLGDHVLAVFGAPVAQEDHAQRAVLAALELQRRVREAGIDGRAQQGDALRLRVGLHTGQVAVGGIGDATAGLAAVVGETVMRALALQAQAVPGRFCAATRRLIWCRRPCESRRWPPCPSPGNRPRSRPTRSLGHTGGVHSAPWRAECGRRSSGATTSWGPCAPC